MGKHFLFGLFFLLFLSRSGYSSIWSSPLDNVESENGRGSGQIPNSPSLSSSKSTAQPKQSCYIGAYRVSNPPFNSCSGWRTCEKGAYCSNGLRKLCPAGTFGAVEGLTNSSCSGACPKGHYCPEGTTIPHAHKCGDITVGGGMRSVVQRISVNPKNSPNYLLGPNNSIAMTTDNSSSIIPDTTVSAGNFYEILLPGVGWDGSISGESKDRLIEDSIAAGFYCPLGSATPIAVPDGYYSMNSDGSTSVDTSNDDMLTRSSIEICPPGSYCKGGIKYICAEGLYGNTSGLASSNCSGPCSPGYYCPQGSTSSKQFSCRSGGNKASRHYCPPASGHPLPTAMGYYAFKDSPSVVDDEAAGFDAQAPCERGSYCIDGQTHLCAGGTWGGITMQTNASCSGICAAGYYCPPGSIGPKQIPCGNTSFYCPAGSASPIHVSPGYYTARNEPYATSNSSTHWTQFVNRTLTPANAANIPGCIEMANNNSGICIKSTTTAAYPSDTLPSSSLNRPQGEELYQMVYSTQIICEPGFYCLPDGIRHLCPRGRYGSRSGLSERDCDGVCEAGYYCPEGSTSPQQNKCGSVDMFCPTGSHFPQPVTQGYYTVNTQGLDQNVPQLEWADPLTRTAERRCEPRYYCSGGIKKMCKAGAYGSEYGLTNETCSGLCSPGFYCPVGSLSATEIPCGEPGKYCPGYGNWKPTDVSPGYYSIGGANQSTNSQAANSHASFDPSVTRTGQALAPIGHYAMGGILRTCKAGYFGASEGMTSPDCSGPCTIPGYYCPTGSTSPVMRKCGGDGFICPSGSVAPLRVPQGFYTADYAVQECKPGYFRNWSLSIDATLPTDAFYTNSKNESFRIEHQKELQVSIAGSVVVTSKSIPSCQLCPNGTFKNVVGDSYSLCRSCGSPSVAQSTEDMQSCECVRVLSKPGQISFFNVTTATCMTIDMSQYRYIDDAAWVTNTSLTRYNANECEPGYYCIDSLRYNCPAGRYGGMVRETRPHCQGICNPGYICVSGSVSPYAVPCGGPNTVCPEGTLEPIAVPPGSYSNEDEPENLRTSFKTCPKGSYCPGDGKRYLCQEGTYSDVEGMISPSCVGLCDAGYYCTKGSTSRQQYPCGNATVYCVRGSSAPTQVHSGFYSIRTGTNAGALSLWNPSNSTQTAEIPCEPGYYCIDGIKQPCPPGRFGWRYGMNSSLCGGICAPGYYCPSYLAPQPDAPSHTVWPGKPHLQAAAPEFECGGVGFFCPSGSFYPMFVGGGNYTTGGSSDNRTRSGQEMCSPGTYCSNGMAFACPKGKYGDTSGLSVPECSGWCTKGHYCPTGTANPIVCPPNYYSEGAAWLCSECPGARSTPLTCNDKRSCCFMG